MRTTLAPAPRRLQRGVSLFESLVAFVVLAASTVAVGQWQSQLRLAGDVARERSAALRLAEEEIDTLRAFAVVDGGPAERAFAAIADRDSVAADAGDGRARTAYRLARRIVAGDLPGAKELTVAVAWTDRSGAAQRIALHSFVAGVAPAYAGALALGAGAVPTAPRGVGARAPSIPVAAKDLGDGRSGWKPSERGAVALVFANGSGEVVGRCEGVAATRATRDLAAADLAGCAAGRWLLVAGTVRFAPAPPPAAGDGAPLPTAISVALSHGRYPAPASCFSEAQKTVRYRAGGSLHIDAVAADAGPESAGVAAWDETGDRFVAWHCIVPPRADGRWSGRVTLVATSGWAIGSGSGGRRVCRYVGGGDGADADAIDANISAAGEVSDVAAPLLAQNFLVVAASRSCPADPPTVPHQP